MIRFEIPLPLFYNDGRSIEPEKFLEADDEIVRRFGASSTDTVVVRGRLLYQSTLYQDQLIRVRIDVEDAPENWQSAREMKETLKMNFAQVVYWFYWNWNCLTLGKRH